VLVQAEPKVSAR